MQKHLVIFSDLDGTLLDSKNYSFEKALPALTLIKEKKIPLIFCTSKTRGEVELYRDLLDNSHPFIVENGGAVCVPKDYFPFVHEYDHILETYFIMELGTPYPSLVKNLDELKKKTGAAIKGFSDMTAEEIASYCNLPMDQAVLAKQREYDEPFLILAPEDVPRVEEALGLRCAKGDRFYHLTGSDKGKAVSILIDLFKKLHTDILSVGLGNCFNDLPMLSSVDIPILVQLENGSYHSKVQLLGLRFADGAGPVGWKKAVMEICNEQSETMSS